MKMYFAIGALKYGNADIHLVGFVLLPFRIDGHSFDGDFRLLGNLWAPVASSKALTKFPALYRDFNQ